jgi:hypothetical protein
VWTIESLRHPRGERVERAQSGDAFVLNRGEDGAADQNLASGITFSFGVVRARDKPRAFGAQSRKASVE